MREWKFVIGVLLILRIGNLKIRGLIQRDQMSIAQVVDVHCLLRQLVFPAVVLRVSGWKFFLKNKRMI
jgi:hypothetical protein